uniref:Fibronectin type-III domain-containing protein n=1 Tax=Angiostrongylus cantonensis TaxID=6313 RepID=A0A158PBU1_ANGCA
MLNAIGYRIAFQEYLLSVDNDTWATVEIPPNSTWPVKSHHLLQNLASFRHYVVRMSAFNSEGNGPFSSPIFIYVGYSIPKKSVSNVIVDPLSSTSLSVRWDPWSVNEDEAITGFKVRFVPVTSVLSPSSHEEELMVVENNSCIITDLRKYTEYQISITPYNRAGEGNVAQVRMRTLEDVPGTVGALKFSDILLDSVHVSWKPPVEPNGVITGYIVNYRTFKMKEEFKKEVQSRTQQTFYPATNLEEGVTYFFAVWAETSAGRGTEVTGNVTLGPNPGGPFAPTRLSLTPGPSSVTLEWKDDKREDIIGHLIQAKLVSKDSSDVRFKKPNKRSIGRPTHIHGIWVTLRVVEGTGQQYEVSYRELEPSSFYVFRVFARNELGIGKASAESEQLFVPAFIPEDPFYTKWWFIIMVAMSTFVVIVLLIAFLCITVRALFTPGITVFVKGGHYGVTLFGHQFVTYLLMQARMIRYDVIGLAETRRRHKFDAVYDTGEQLFLGTCDSRGVGGVGVFIITSLSMNIDSSEQLITRIGRLRLKRCGSIPALTIFVVYAQTSNYDEEEVEAFYMCLDKFYREDHTFFNAIIGDFNAKTGPRRTSEERHIGTHGLERNEQSERLSEFIMTNKTPMSLLLFLAMKNFRYCRHVRSTTVKQIHCSAAKYKRDKRHSVDSLHLANGNFVAFQMEANHRDLRSRNDLPTRPGTKQSWLSDRDPPAYGSILGDQERLRGRESVDGGGSVVNMYGLETDAIPTIPNQEALNRLSTLVGRDVRGSAYVTQRETVDMLSKSKYGNRCDYGNPLNRSQHSRGSSVRMGYNHMENAIHLDDFADDSFDDEDDGHASVKDEADHPTENIASHYGASDQYRDTWRRVKASDAICGPVPPGSSSRAVSTESSESSTAFQAQPNLSSGFSSFV